MEPPGHSYVDKTRSLSQSFSSLSLCLSTASIGFGDATGRRARAMCLLPSGRKGSRDYSPSKSPQTSPSHTRPPESAPRPSRSHAVMRTQEKLKEVLCTLSEDRKACDTRNESIKGLELEALTCALLLDLVNPRSRSYPSPDQSTNPTWGYIEVVPAHGMRVVQTRDISPVDYQRHSDAACTPLRVYYRRSRMHGADHRAARCYRSCPRAETPSRQSEDQGN